MIASPPATPPMPRQPGPVYVVGAGPGDPELITVRGLRCLRRADVVLYDRLVHPRLLDEAPASAETVFVGKAPGKPGLGQAGIHRLLIAHAREGRIVVRLKGGDPFVFGRGSEEAEALTAAGIPWEVVPAVSSALAVPARAHIPVTHRGVAASFAVVTAHRARRPSTSGGEQDGSEPDWEALARIDTLVVLMGVAALPRIVETLLAHGRSPETPAAIVERGTLADERVVEATLATLAEQAAMAGIRSPATVVIGDVVAVRRSLTDQPTADRSILTADDWPSATVGDFAPVRRGAHHG